jgi:hypothetical protein
MSSIQAAPQAHGGVGGDAQAVAIWRLLRTRSAADRRVVFLALSGRLGSGVNSGITSTGQRAELAVRSLLLCASSTGRAPSRRDYDGWHGKQSDRREWASATTIRNAFGTWTKALAACGLEPSLDVRGRSLAAFGRPFAKEELVVALQAWDREAGDGDRSFASYGRFVHRVRGDWAGDGRRLPRGLTAFHREYGSWAAALAAAGVELPDDQHSRGVRSRGARRHYTRDRMIEWLHAASGELNVRRIGMQQYDRWAQDRCAEALAAGNALSIARSNTVTNRFGSWGSALAAAGLISDQQATRVAPAAAVTSEEDMLAALARAIRDAGRDEGRVLTMTEYTAWRCAQTDLDGRRSGCRILSASPIRNHFGRWNDAICAALNSDAELAGRFTTRPGRWVTRWDAR